jgi:beta-galactosidase
LLYINIEKTNSLSKLSKRANKEGRMQRQLWNEDWRFSIETTPEQWQTIHLPHSAKTEAIHRSAMWQGRCTYRKQLNIDPTWEDKVVGLHFEAAMLKATVTCNGQVIAEHEGGYTPFKAILPQSITHGTARSVEIAVILDNRYDPNIPPAKPLDELDFKWYHGIYRNVYLEVEPSLHISDAFTEDSHLRSGLKLSTHINDNNQAVLDYSLEIVNRGN